MLNNALAYLAKRSLKQARIMNNQFYEIIDILEKFSGIGMCAFRYNIYYLENEDNIDILGIWHTNRGTEFEEQ